jgi:hypothetical protein
MTQFARNVNLVYLFVPIFGTAGKKTVILANSISANLGRRKAPNWLTYKGFKYRFNWQQQVLI